MNRPLVYVEPEPIGFKDSKHREKPRIVYLPSGSWRWEMNQNGINQWLNLFTVPQLNLMIFWNDICATKVTYSKSASGKYIYHKLQDGKTESVSITNKLKQLIQSGEIAKPAIDPLVHCGPSDLVALRYLLETDQITVGLNSLTFEDTANRENGTRITFNKQNGNHTKKTLLT